MVPFREHLKPSSTFYQDDPRQQVFEQSKAAMLETSLRVAGYSTPNVSWLATDWSKKSIGFWLLQKYCTCEVITPICCSTGWKIVFASSRFTHAAESRYAPVTFQPLKLPTTPTICLRRINEPTQKKRQL